MHGDVNWFTFEWGAGTPAGVTATVTGLQNGGTATFTSPNVPAGVFGTNPGISPTVVLSKPDTVTGTVRLQLRGITNAYAGRVWILGHGTNRAAFQDLVFYVPWLGADLTWSVDEYPQNGPECAFLRIRKLSAATNNPLAGAQFTVQLISASGASAQINPLSSGMFELPLDGTTGWVGRTGLAQAIGTAFTIDGEPSGGNVNVTFYNGN